MAQLYGSTLMAHGERTRCGRHPRRCFSRPADIPVACRRPGRRPWRRRLRDTAGPRGPPLPHGGPPRAAHPVGSADGVTRPGSGAVAFGGHRRGASLDGGRRRRRRAAPGVQPWPRKWGAANCVRHDRRPADAGRGRPPGRGGGVDAGAWPADRGRRPAVVALGGQDTVVRGEHGRAGMPRNTAPATSSSSAPTATSSRGRGRRS